MLARDYGRCNFNLLRGAVGRSRWPATFGGAFEFARPAASSPEFDDVARFVMAQVAPTSSGELFFLGTRTFAGDLAHRDAEESLAELAREPIRYQGLLWATVPRIVSLVHAPGLTLARGPTAKELGAVARGTLGHTRG
jgi:hypothetical protein